jgi:hypothetical protein
LATLTFDRQHECASNFFGFAQGLKLSQEGGQAVKARAVIGALKVAQNSKNLYAIAEDDDPELGP